MSWILKAKDKSGRIIYLSKERWAHILKHPEMVNQQHSIRETLQKPDILNKFKFEPSIRFYYRYSKQRKQYLFISVKYLNGKGFIITAFYTDKIK